ncbi:PAS domain-containing protein [Zoogloeaceae bacterium G21618-S1]|nr:PAS domain-containing protein [Zoogloeaceae bacterium G21618-S1]
MEASTLAELCTGNFPVAAPDTMATEIRGLVAERGMLVVIEDDRPVGVLTAALLLEPPLDARETVRDRMAPVVVIDARLDCATGYQHLLKTSACALVLVDDTGGLIGLVGERELLHYFSGRATTRSTDALESTDISLRKALNEVRHSDHVLDSVFSALPDLFFRMRHDGTIIDYRARTGDDLYAPPEYFLGKRMHDVLPKATAQQFSSKLKQVIDTGQMASFEYALEVAMHTRHFEARLCQLDDRAQVIAVVRDITDSYATTKALHESEARLSFALDATEGGVWDWDLASDTCCGSARYFTQLGYPAESGPITRADCLAHIHPDDQSIFEQHMVAQRKVGAPPFDIEIRMRHADGNDRWIRRKGKTVEWDTAGRPARVVGTHTDISARKADELALQALNQKLENAQSLAHVGWWEWSPATDESRFSDELLRIYGLNRARHPPTHHDCFKHVVAEDRDRVQRAHEAAFENGRLECEFAIHRYDSGERRDVKTIGHVSFDDQKQPVKLFGVTADITELRDIGRRYALSAQISESATWEIWPNEGRLQADANLARLTGDAPNTPPHTLGDLLSRLPDEDAQDFLNALKRITDGDTDTIKLDHRVLRRDGQTAWLHVQGQRVSGRDETPVRILGSSMNVTEQKLAERRIRDSEFRFRAIASLAPVGIFRTDTQGQMTYGNSRLCAITGVDLKQALGDGWVQALHPDDRERVHAAWQTMLDTRQPFHSEYRFQRPDGKIIWVFGAAEALTDADGQVTDYLGIIFDITERMQADVARREHIHFLESLEKLDAALHASGDMNAMLKRGTAAILAMFDCDRSWLLAPCDPDAQTWQIQMASTRPGCPGAGPLDTSQPIPPDIAAICRTTLASTAPVMLTEERDSAALASMKADSGIRSLMIVALHPSTGPSRAICIHHCRHAREWTPNEHHLFAEAARRVAIAIDLHAAIQALRASEIRYRSVVEDLPIMLCRNRTDGTIEFVNQAYCEYFGKPAEALIGQNLLDLIPPSSRDDISHQFLSLNADTPLITHEQEVIDGMGNMRWQRWTNRAICNAQGEVVMLQAFGEDITERKQVEQTLVRQRRELAEAQEQAHLGSFVWNISSGEIRWSDELFRLFGLDPKTQPPTYGLFIGAVHADDTARVDAAFKGALRDAIPFHEEFRLTRPNGEPRWLFAQGQIETEPTDRSVLMRGTVLDITERVLATKALQKAHDELEQRVEQRTAELKATNAELEAFTYAASHDLRAPLRAIQGFQRALDEDFGPEIPEGAQDFLSEIAKASARMGDLIDGLLELSRSSRASLVRQTLDLADIAQSIHARLARSQPDRRVTLHCEGPIIAVGDSRLLATAMQNLLENAWKYTSIRAQATIHFTSSMQDGQRVYCLDDNGAGFDPAFANKLFEPFQRLHHPSEFPGIGIGLATVARIARRHGGWIEGLGRPGEGASFRFSLGPQEGSTQ